MANCAGIGGNMTRLFDAMIMKFLKCASLDHSSLCQLFSYNWLESPVF